jgi:transketolase
MKLEKEDKKFLENKARDIRISIVEMLAEAGSGHTAGPLGMVDVFTTLYFKVLKHNPKKPDWEERERVVLSNGHICPVLYATMAHAGYFPIEELKTLRNMRSRLQGHPHREFLNFLETSSGPLGSGLSQSAGMALADRLDGINDRFIYCLMSDGELDCGNTWEGAMLAGKEKLENLIAVVDRNNIQIDGFTEDIMPLEPLSDKWQSFNWRTIEVNGHDFESILNGFEEAKNKCGKPTVILSNNTPGKGVKEWENKWQWHGKPPTKEEAEKAKVELGGKL